MRRSSFLLFLLLATCCGPMASSSSRNSWTQPTASRNVANTMAHPRALHQATPLSDGHRVLVTGGHNSVSYALSAAELYDHHASDHRWTSAPSMHLPRTYHTATLLSSSSSLSPDTASDVVLVAGGLCAANSPATNTAEVYDVSSQTWTYTGAMQAFRSQHTATLLGDGTVLVAGGSGDASSETYNGALDVWVSVTDKMNNARYGHDAVLLSNGDVLIAGGYTYEIFYLETELSGTAEVYCTSSANWITTGSMQYARALFTMTLLNDGTVLAAGGLHSLSFNRVEVYTPLTEKWTTVESLLTPRSSAAAALLPNGNVLVTGGCNSGDYLLTTELYHPHSQSWAAAASMNTAREGHSATLLKNGDVVVAGGYNDQIGYLASSEYYEFSYIALSSGAEAGVIIVMALVLLAIVAGGFVKFRYLPNRSKQFDFHMLNPFYNPNGTRDTKQPPASANEPPASVSQTPASVNERPVSTTSERPVSTSERPISTSERPISTNEYPVSADWNADGDGQGDNTASNAALATSVY